MRCILYGESYRVGKPNPELLYAMLYNRFHGYNVTASPERAIQLEGRRYFHLDHHRWLRFGTFVAAV